MALRMMLAFPDLPSCVTLVFRGRPTVGRGRHRLRRGWLVFMQVVHPGRRTLEAMPRTHVPPTSDQRTRGPRDTIGTGRSTFWTYHTRLGWRPVGAVTVVLSKKGRNEALCYNPSALATAADVSPRRPAGLPWRPR